MVEEMEGQKPYMFVDLGEDGGRLEWATYEDVLKWINELRNAWGWIGGQSKFNPIQRAWHTLSSNFEAIANSLQQARNFHNQGLAPQASNQLASTKSAIENFIRQYLWLLPNSAKRQFVEELNAAGKSLEAATIVALWQGQDLNGVPVRQLVSGLLYLELYERGIKDRAKGESVVLKRLASDMQTQLTQFQADERNLINRFDTLHLQASQQTVAQQAAFDGVQAERDGQWKQQIADAKNELELLKTTYDQHMALAAPVDYWEAKRAKHFVLTILFGALVLASMLILGLLLSTELHSIDPSNLVVEITGAVVDAHSQPAATKALATQSEVTNKAVTTWKLATFILLAVLGFWFVRLLVRVFLSNLHLENDAAERVTMAKTYLALIRNNDLRKEDSINTVLAALFRPTGDGIVKDDGIPPSYIDFLTKLGK